jgi:hypothetical protein
MVTLSLPQCMHECKHPLAPSIFWSSRKSSTQSFPSTPQSRVRPVMEVQPDIQQRSGLDRKQSGSQLGLPGHRTYGLQLIQRSEPKVGQHCLAH